MVVRLELKPEVEARVVAEAEARGMSVEDYVQLALEAGPEIGTAEWKFITENAKQELLANFDPLTHALNRRAFLSLVSHNQPSALHEIGCVAVVDIKSLKSINHQFGHNVGDKVIRAVARAARSLMGSNDMLFRWGGDEFVILMFQLHEGEALRRLLTLHGILEHHSSEWTSGSVKIGLSSGLSGFLSQGDLPNAVERARQSAGGGHALDKSLRPDPNALPYEEWVQRWNKWLGGHNHITAPLLSDEAISRENIYREREDKQL